METFFSFFSVSFSVEKSITIAKPLEDVKAKLVDFRQWREWSPWLITERTAAVEAKGNAGEVGHSQSWEGRYVGKGDIKIESISTKDAKNFEAKFDLHFFSPWESRAKTMFSCVEDDEGNTKITWHMDGSLPIFMFWMRSKMAGWVGSDYNRGLSMLKELLETGEILSEIIAPEPFVSSVKPGFTFVGVRSKCAVAEIGPSMDESFKKLQEAELPKPDATIAFYHDWDFVNGHCDYTSAYVYNKAEVEKKADFIVETVPEHTVVTVVHQGKYMHLGNAWSAVMSRIMREKMTMMKSISPYEVYENDCNKVAAKELRVSVHVPIATK